MSSESTVIDGVARFDGDANQSQLGSWLDDVVFLDLIDLGGTLIWESVKRVGNPSLETFCTFMFFYITDCALTAGAQRMIDLTRWVVF